MNPPRITTPQALAIRLHLLAIELEEVGGDVDYHGGFAPWAKYGRDLIDNAALLAALADEIDGAVNA